MDRCGETIPVALKITMQNSLKAGDKVSVRSANMQLATMSVLVDIHSEAEVLIVDKGLVAYVWYDENGDQKVGICRDADVELIV